jgi:hypothetical protein
MRGHAFRLIRRPLYAAPGVVGIGTWQAICTCGFVADAETERLLKTEREHHWTKAPKR